jgi:hypothetical protein
MNRSIKDWNVYFNKWAPYFDIRKEDIKCSLQYEKRNVNSFYESFNALIFYGILNLESYPDDDIIFKDLDITKDYTKEELILLLNNKYE